MARLRIVVGGMLAGVPGQGGATWAVLQYVLGLRELGHKVCFVERVDPAGVLPRGTSLGQSLSAAYFRNVTRAHDLDADCALLLAGTHDTVGATYAQLQRRCQQADVLLDLSGLLADEELTAAIPERVFVDLDPAFTQCWHDQGIDVGLSGHTRFVTVGLAIGDGNCPVPTCGVDWITTLQPVVLSAWPTGQNVAHDGLTTVANWRGYGSVTHEGVHYGQKAHSLRELIALPERSQEPLVLALEIHPDEQRDIAALRGHGWQLVDPVEVAGTPQAYQRFVQGSKGEIGVAKSGYVRSRCGWFSDRSACYLASGRPVVAQDTGFSRFLPTGDGLLAFSGEEQALRAIASVHRDHDRHRRAARALAEEHFASGRVLTRLLEAVT